jgi:hypothetical protein
MSEADTNRIFTELPCLGCGNWQRDRALTILGALYLALERGEKVNVPTRAQLTAGCCQAKLPEGSITFIMPGQVDPPTPWSKRFPR